MNMSVLTLFGIAVGLSMDAFAVSITSGCSIKKNRRFYFIMTALAFGLFQAGMPLLGWAMAFLFQPLLERWAHWISFILLVILGIRMIREGLDARKKGSCDDPDQYEFSLSKLFLLSVATSIDALLIGISLSLLGYSLWVPAAFIGMTTFLLSLAGLIAGKYLQVLFQESADFLGGGILILLAVKILYEGLF